MIHTNIFGSFPTPFWNGQHYFISFIDDNSIYAFIFLIHEKSQLLDVFKSFKAGVENQLNKIIKKVKSDRGSEYYGRYDSSGGQCHGPFSKYLEECGIVPHYIKYIVRSMICHSTLSESLCRETLKTAIYILNRVSTKTAAKTPYEL